jgi:hypothetical protein
VNAWRRWHISEEIEAEARHARAAQGFTCPACGARSVDAGMERPGYCSRCRGFTGLCGAGRFAVHTGVINAGDWHRPCPALGVERWEFVTDGQPTPMLLCAAHAADMRGGKVPWAGELPLPASGGG